MLPRGESALVLAALGGMIAVRESAAQAEFDRRVDELKRVTDKVRSEVMQAEVNRRNAMARAARLPAHSIISHGPIMVRRGFLDHGKVEATWRMVVLSDSEAGDVVVRLVRRWRPLPEWPRIEIEGSAGSYTPLIVERLRAALDGGGIPYEVK